MSAAGAGLNMERIPRFVVEKDTGECYSFVPVYGGGLLCSENDLNDMMKKVIKVSKKRGSDFER
jgi:hypothetical protein